MPYLLGWLLGVPVIVLVILYLIFHRLRGETRVIAKGVVTIRRLFFFPKEIR
jgi:hypothetical protein